MSYSPWGLRESDTTERLTFTFIGLEAERVELWREPAQSHLEVASGEAITVSSPKGLTPLEMGERASSDKDDLDPFSISQTIDPLGF